MTTYDTTAVPDTLLAPGQRAAERAVGDKGWAYAGVGAGLAGITAVAGSMMAGAVYDQDLAGDAEGLTALIAEQVPQILVLHVGAMVSALLLLVFAAGLRRHLAGLTPQGSLLPSVASSGLHLVAVALLMGSALTTEFVFGLQDTDMLVPETAVFFGHWIGTVPWLWVGAGVAALALGLTGRRHGGVPGWLTWTSLVLGALVTLLGVSPLQYMAGMLGPVWLTLAAIGLLRRA